MRYGKGLIRNIIKGNLIKGDLDFKLYYDSLHELAESFLSFERIKRD